MSDEVQKPKTDLTKSVVRDMIDTEVREEIEKLKAEAAARPSIAVRAVEAGDSFDFTSKYPKSAVAIGIALLIGATVAHGYGKLDTTPMYVLWGIAVCFVPGLAMKTVRLATGLKKAKDA